MYRTYVAIRCLHKLYGKKDFDLMVSKFELFSRTWLYTDFRFVRDRGELPHYDFRKDKIDDLMTNAERLDFIKKYDPNRRDKFVVTPKGRRFLNPVYFLQYTADELDKVVVILLSSATTTAVVLIFKALF